MDLTWDGTNTSRPDPDPSEETWANWIEGDNNTAHSHPIYSDEAGTDSRHLSMDFTEVVQEAPGDPIPASSPISMTIDNLHEAAPGHSSYTLGECVPQDEQYNDVSTQKRPFYYRNSSNESGMSATFDGGDDIIQTPGYLNIQTGGRIRYVGDAFWGLIKGHEPLCNTFLDQNPDYLANASASHVDSFELASVLKVLPAKSVCDKLLSTFLIGVRPIHPLIHVPTFQTDYDSFWLWCQHNDLSRSGNKLLDDPTFLCLLFSILYCGATTASPQIWAAGVLQGLEREMMIGQLKTALATSLKMFQHLEHPTLNTLVSSLLAHSCSNEESEPVNCLKFVSMVVRIAQSMGIHREGTLFGLDAVSCELRRRVWWHIVSLDVQASILNGSQTCCSGSAVQHDIRMVAETRDEDLFETGADHFSPFLTPSLGGSSVVMLFAIGHFETARFKHLLISDLHSARGLGRAQFNDFVSGVKKLHLRLDKLIARIPAQGIPEKGLLPSRLMNASPLTHEGLYADHTSQPTVLTSWTRIMLTMLKAEVAILLQKSFIGRADLKSKQGQRMWKSIVQACITYLRNFLQVTQISAFAPFKWYYSTHYAPCQCVFIVLTYLEYNGDSENAPLARYFVDEVFDIFASDEQSSTSGMEGHDPPGSIAKSSKQMTLSWRMLITLRNKLALSTWSETAPVQGSGSLDPTAGSGSSSAQGIGIDPLSAAFSFDPSITRGRPAFSFDH